MYYEIDIVETLCRTVKVKAESYEDALAQVSDDYYHGRIVLDENDFLGADFEYLREYACEVKTSPFLDYDSDVFYVNRIGKFGTKDYPCETLTDAYLLGEKLAQDENNLSVYIWN